MLAHRGLATEYPENTLPAFAAAVALGAEYIELDVHASSDGIAVVAHDPDLTRLLGVNGVVSAHTAAELEALDLGGGVGFSSLASVLAELPDVRVNIDIKAEAAAEPAAAAIRSAHAIGRVLVTSFSDERRRSTTGLLPGVATSASARSFLTALIGAKLGIQALVTRALRNVDAVQVPERALGMRITTPRVLQSIHAAGAEMHVWTINDPVRMTRLLELGVDGIVTDRIDLALDVLRTTAHRDSRP